MGVQPKLVSRCGPLRGRGNASADRPTVAVLGLSFEYPPLSILFFVLPPVKGTLATYHHWFAFQMIAIDAITAVVTAAAAMRIWNGLGGRWLRRSLLRSRWWPWARSPSKSSTVPSP